MWGKIMVPMYRLWLHGLYRPHRPLSTAVKFNQSLTATPNMSWRTCVVVKQMQSKLTHCYPSLLLRALIDSIKRCCLISKGNPIVEAWLIRSIRAYLVKSLTFFKVFWLHQCPCLLHADLQAVCTSSLLVNTGRIDSSIYGDESVNNWPKQHVIETIKLLHHCI